MMKSATGWTGSRQTMTDMYASRFLLVLTAFAVFLVPSCTRTDRVDVIPAPAQVSMRGPRFALSDLGTPRFEMDAAVPAEGYELRISRRGIRIKASDPAGFFYAGQTLKQLAGEDETVPACTIKDAPRFGWRAYMLDASRHFVEKEKIFQILDLMARYKLNKFHWHLTDSDAWRLELEGLPELTRIGARGCHSNPEAPARYYSLQDVRDIVAYAAARHIEVIPEIDMPGHASASNRAYPEYSGGGSERYPDFTFNVGKEETYAYLSGILGQVAEQFPGRYIHIGGDEVDFAIQAWESKPEIQELISREKLDGLQGAEAWFDRRMQGVVAGLGRTCLMWCDAVEYGLPKESTVLYWWRHDRKDMLRRGLEEGYPTVLCPRHPLYFDFVQADSLKYGRTQGGPCTLEEVHAYPDTEKDAFAGGAVSPLVLGVEACLWTELVENGKRVDFMTLPRLAALAEAAWTKAERKDFAAFSALLEREYGVYDRMGLWYYDRRDPARHGERPEN